MECQICGSKIDHIITRSFDRMGNDYSEIKGLEEYEEDAVGFDTDANWFLDFEVKILDKQEEPEIDIQGIEEITHFGIKQNQDGINLLIRAIKQLDNQINNK